MELVIKLAWLGIAAIHATPALVILRPSLVEKLYGVPSSGTIGLLLTHRGGLFLAVFVACVLAAFQPSGRLIAAAVAGISMTSFLVLYYQAGMPLGSLRKIAIADTIGVPLLILVTYFAMKS